MVVIDFANPRQNDKKVALWDKDSQKFPEPKHEQISLHMEEVRWKKLVWILITDHDQAFIVLFFIKEVKNL